MYLRKSASRLCNRLRNSAHFRNSPPNSVTRKLIVSSVCDSGGYKWSKQNREFQWLLLSGPAAFILGTCSLPSLADDASIGSSDTNASDFTGLRKIEDGSVISNEHTSKWRVFTDNGRDYFLQGNVLQAERFFVSALQEAKKGFGERDPHVASACNNLAEIFRVKRDFDSAEPLYMEAINILEEYYGPDDIRVGAALHNLGQFYLGQRKLERARVSYERALKIKRRVLGEAHREYADTMYHLGSVLFLQGKQKDSEDLILNSIQILEAGGQGDSMICIRRMQYLAQMYNKWNRFDEAVTLLRQILHIMESSKGWKSLDTVIAAERLALGLQKAGRLKEAEKLLERCLGTRKKLLPAEHVQNATNMFHIARVKMLISNQIKKTNSSQSLAELDLAKDLLHDSVRIARKVLDRSVEQKGKKQPIGAANNTGKEVHAAAVSILQSLNALALVETMKLDFQSSRENTHAEANAALHQCISTFKEFGSESSISDSPLVKVEYLSCLRHLQELMSKGLPSELGTEKEITDEIRRVEGDVLKAGITSI